ncbi:MAG: acyltransferase [Nitrospinae bacterium]|nr:acyltransferase [Nitrospinota bacterium]
MKLGFVQNHPVFGKVRENVDRALEMLAGQEADLIVLPELFSTGYQFAGREEALELAEPIPDGPTARRLIDLARSQKTALVAGLAERDGKTVYNSALVVGAQGYIGKYRKAHLFDAENDVFQPGDLPLPVFDVGPCRVGVMICFDWRFPETARTLALNGADAIAHPSNLVLPHCPQAMITRCLENRVYAVTADRVGTEARVPGESLKFVGQSQVVDPDGQVLYRASVDREETKILEIDVAKARNKKINFRNDLLAGRRLDLYRLN